MANTDAQSFNRKLGIPSGPAVKESLHFFKADKTSVSEMAVTDTKSSIGSFDSTLRIRSYVDTAKIFTKGFHDVSWRR